MRCIAHRGFAAEAPENTIGAVRRAAARGADAVEVDLRASKEGPPVVIHDATVDRVTDASGAVNSLTAGELGQLDVLGSGEGVPTLAALLEAIPGDLDLVIECKEPGLADAIWRLVDDATNDVLVSSFLPDALREVGTVSDLQRALLAHGGGPDPVERAVELGCSAVHYHHAACDESFVRQAHDAGLDVAAWTVDDVAEARRLERDGVDGIITDSGACCGLAER